MSYGQVENGESGHVGQSPTTLRRRLALGPVFGTFQISGSATTTEVLAYAGAEVIVADAEHAALDLAMLEQIVRAGELRRASILIRVPGVGMDLGRALDTGAAGVVAPRVETAAQAQQLVKTTRFPPLGGRGLGPARATMYGLDLHSHHVNANETLTVVAMVETKDGLENIDEIASVSGIDVLMVGPADLASSLGVAVGSQKHAAAVDRILTAALNAGLHAGIHCANAEQALNFANKGVRFLLIGTDVSLLSDGVQAAFSPTIALPMT